MIPLCQATNGAPGTTCRSQVWGQTAYCAWHNAFLSWRVLALQMRKNPKSAAWAAYDPHSVDWNVSPKVTGVDSFAGMFAVPVAIAYLAVLGKSPFHTSIAQQVDVALWLGSFVATQAMLLGNSNLAFPKLLLAIALTKVGLGLSLLIGKGVALGLALPELVGSLGLLLLALPPPRGPLRHTDADPLDPRQLPPINVGQMMVRGVGRLGVAVGAVWFIAALLN